MKFEVLLIPESKPHKSKLCLENWYSLICVSGIGSRLWNKWQPTPVFLPGEFQGRGACGLQSMGSHRDRHDWRLSSSSSRPWEHISKFNKLMWSLTSVSFYNINASAYLSRSTAVPQLWNSGDIDWGVGWDLQEICSIGHVPALGIHNRAGVRTHLCIDCSVWHISTTRSYNNHTSGLSLSFSFHTSLLIQKKDSTNLKSHFCIRTFLSVFQIYQLC